MPAKKFKKGVKAAAGLGRRRAGGKRAGTRNAHGQLGERGGRQISANALFKYILLSAAIFSAGMFFMINQEPGEQFSQLSLIDKSLPVRVEAGTRFTFGFEALNHEGRGMVYEYSVLVDGEETGRKKIALQNGERKVFYEDALIAGRGAHEIGVLLEREGKPPLSVFFRLEVV